MIPKIIHYCWFGGNPIPEKDRKCIESWKRHCPDYEIIEWNESNYDVTKNAYMYEAYQARKWGFVPDYARLDIIYHNGGIYLDTDVEVIRSLDDLLTNKGIMGFEDLEHVSPGLLIAAEKGNKTIKYLIDSIYSDRHFLLDDGTYDLTPSPFMNSDALSQKGMTPNGTKQIVEDITIYPSEYFSPLDYSSGKLNKTSNTYSIHWFNSSWYTKNQRRVRDIERRFRSDNKMIHSFGRLLSLPFRIAAKYETKGWKGVVDTIRRRCGI